MWHNGKEPNTRPCLPHVAIERAMKPIVKSVLGALLGVACGVVTIMALQAALHIAFPPPPGLNLNDPAAVRELAARMPTAAIVLALLSELAGGFVGALVAARFARHAPLVPGMIVGGFFLLGSILNMKLIPHPMWCWFI